jgi:carboxylate-amine ligase
MDAPLIEVDDERGVPARELLTHLVEACRPHADALGCSDELERVLDLAASTGAERQVALAHEHGRLPGLIEVLADAFADEGG